MTQLARLKDFEITEGQVIYADDLEAEIDQLLNESNSQDTRLDAIEADYVATGDNPSFGKITLSSAPTASGQVGYSSNLLKYHNGTSEVTVATLGDIVLPNGYRYGSHPYWASVATVVVPSGYSCYDDGDAETITVGSDLTVNLGSSGALGLDTGTEASDTPYYIWLCSGGSGTTAIFSASKTTPTLPSGYNTYKRRLPGAWHNDSSSNLIKGDFFGDLNYPTFIYNVTLNGITASPTTLVSGSSSHPTTFTDLSVPYIPADSEMVYLYAHSYTAGNDTHIRADGESHDGYVLRGIGSNPVTGDVWIKAPSQTLEWKTDNAANSIGIHVQGYAVTEAC